MHDEPYTFALPLSWPQGLAWVRLMVKIQRGEAEWASIRRSYAIQVFVLPTHEVSEYNPLAREKLAPLLSMFSVADEQAGVRMCEQILALEGTGHTAIIYTHMPSLEAEFGARMPASRILVNAPGTQGGMGLATGLQPSLTLGCGTFGCTSTTDNVTYTHLLNLKRVASSIPSSRESVLRRLKESVTTFFSQL